MVHVAVRLRGVAVLAGYRREWLRGDVLAGVAVVAYLVPQVMAYSGIAGLPPQAGLWACLGSLTIYALLGSSRQLSVGPESTTALLTATAVAPLALGDPARHAALAAADALLGQSAAAVDADPDGDHALTVATVRAAAERVAREVVDRAPRIVGPAPLSRDGDLARALADLALYVRQHHAERDHAALGGQVVDRWRSA